MENRWTYIEKVPNRNGKQYALYKCECGNTKIVQCRSVNVNLSRSCGCLHKGIVSNLFKTHGRSQSDVYKIWKGITQRTQNPKNSSFASYGARGITMCLEWKDFSVFLSDMGERPSHLHSIERLDNDKSYSKDNCVWAIATVQANNKRNNRFLTLDDLTLNVQQWSEKIGLNEKVLRRRLRLGWNDHKILTTKIVKHGDTV